MSQDISQPEIQNSDELKKEQVKTAFIQVPFELKAQVQEYMEKLTKASGSEFEVSNQSIEALPPQGCFLVISLDKIEEIIYSLKGCLSMEPDNEGLNMKSEINRVLTMLS